MHLEKMAHPYFGLTVGRLIEKRTGFLPFPLAHFGSSVMLSSTNGLDKGRAVVSVKGFESFSTSSCRLLRGASC